MCGPGVALSPKVSTLLNANYVRQTLLFEITK